MIFSSPLPQFGQCCMSMSKTRLSSRAQLMRRDRAYLPSGSTGGMLPAGGGAERPVWPGSSRVTDRGW
ncbi:MAG: hypothetical protein RLZ83_658 [Pseudomonadota bacterium]|jgi:hypothetical protein